MLNKFSEMIRGNLSKMLRSKIVALVTMEVHARDVIEKLIKSGVNDVTAFEWLMQLRVYWDKEIDDCVVRQTNTQFQYGYEYLGNSGRLVITPLTDRYEVWQSIDSTVRCYQFTVSWTMTNVFCSAEGGDFQSWLEVRETIYSIRNVCATCYVQNS